MKRVAVALAIGACAMPTLARGDSVEKRLDAYNRCMVLAAVRASYTSAADHAVYRIARAACAAARDARAIERARQPVYLAAVDAADATRAAHLAAWVAELRERRHAGDMAYGH